MYGKSCHIWEVIPYMESLPVYGKPSPICEGLPYLQGLPRYGKSSHTKGDFPYMGRPLVYGESSHTWEVFSCMYVWMYIYVKVVIIMAEWVGTVPIIRNGYPSPWLIHHSGELVRPKYTKIRQILASAVDFKIIAASKAGRSMKSHATRAQLQASVTLLNRERFC